MLTIGFDNFYTKLHTTEFVLVWTFIHYFCVSFLFCTVVVTSAIHYANSIYSSVTSGPSYFTSSCSGSESHLLNCNFSTTSYCYRQYLAGVRCYGKYYHRYSCSISGVISVMYTSYHSVNSGCTEGGVHPAGGETAMEGRVEVCHNQTWWAVSGSSSYWDFDDATVVCRHLHYTQQTVSCVTKNKF